MPAGSFRPLARLPISPANPVHYHHSWRWAWRNLKFFVPFLHPPGVSDDSIIDIVTGTPGNAVGSGLSGARGRDGYGCHLDPATNNRISFPRADRMWGIQNWNSFTASVIVEHDTGTGADSDDIISWWRHPDLGGDKSFLLLQRNTTGDYFFEVAGKSNINGGTSSANRTHVHATYAAASGAMTLYLDGVQVAQATGLSGAMSSATDNNLILGSQADNTNHFDGIIWGAWMWREELTPTQVLKHYHDPWAMLEREASTAWFFNHGFVSGVQSASPDLVQGRIFSPTTKKILTPGFVRGQAFDATVNKKAKPGFAQGRTFSPATVHIARPGFVQGRVFDATAATVPSGVASPDLAQGRIFDPRPVHIVRLDFVQGRTFDPTVTKKAKPGLVQGRTFDPVTVKIVKLDFVQGRVFDPTASAMAQAAVCGFVQGRVFGPSTLKIVTPDFVQGQIFTIEAGPVVEDDMGIEVSTTTVFNMAATFLNADLVNLSTEDSKTANAFRAIYDITRPEFLMAYPWCGAERHQKLNQYNVDTPEHWDFAFRLPFRFLRLITINPERNRSNPDIEYRIEADAQFHEKILLTQESEVELLYVGNLENLNALPYSVIKALALQLALDAAAVFSKSTSDITALEGRFERQLQRAKSQCSQQKSTRRFGDFDLVKSRHTRGRYR